MLRRKFDSALLPKGVSDEGNRANEPEKLDRKAAQRLAAKQARQQAYQKAKERRAKDPRYLELKEAAKARRREHYARVKQHRKAAQVAQRAARSVERAQSESQARSFFRQRRSINPSKLQQALDGALQEGAVPERAVLERAVLEKSVPVGAGQSELGLGELLAASAEVANDVQ
jgi:hypothetical protein